MGGNYTMPSGPSRLDGDRVILAAVRKDDLDVGSRPWPAGQVAHNRALQTTQAAS